MTSKRGTGILSSFFMVMSDLLDVYMPNFGFILVGAENQNKISKQLFLGIREIRLVFAKKNQICRIICLTGSDALATYSLSFFFAME
jgi:hypothetical protein